MKDDEVLERKKANMNKLASAYTKALKDGSLRKSINSLGTTDVNYTYTHNENK